MVLDGKGGLYAYHARERERESAPGELGHGLRIKAGFHEKHLPLMIYLVYQ